MIVKDKASDISVCHFMSANVNKRTAITLYVVCNGVG